MTDAHRTDLVRVSAQTAASPAGVPTPARAEWEPVDERVRGWWDADLRTSTAADVAADSSGTLLFLPHRYSTAGGAECTFPEMYGWDTHFINLGMLAHGRTDLVRDHIRNQLFMIEKYGMVLNGNRTYYLTRSQPPVLAASVAQYLDAVPDDIELAAEAYAGLAAEFSGYWCAPHHATPARLSTNRDSGDPHRRPELAAEAETGLDFTAIFGGDVRRCAPLLTNCALVRTAQVLGRLAGTIGRGGDAQQWHAESVRRADVIRALCWDREQQFFLEYDHVAGQRLPFRSLAAFWTLWAGVATPRQAAAMVSRLAMFEDTYGLAFTDRPYRNPHPEYPALQWQHPAGWPPMHLIVVAGLQRYGYFVDARRVAGRFLAAQLEEYGRTGQLWEKYDVVHGGVDVPLERYPTPPIHGWSSAAVAVLGRALFDAAGPSASDVSGRSQVTR